MLILAGGTVIERLTTHERAVELVYGAWWFDTLWILAGVGMIIALLRAWRRITWPTRLLHLSFLLILVGGLFTATQRQHGRLLLREGMTADRFISDRDEGGEVSLPFSLTLEDYGTIYSDEGHLFPTDYYAVVTLEGEQHRLSMNRILRHRGYRLFLHALSEEAGTVSLIVSYDPVGMYVVYSGFALGLIAFLMLLVGRRGPLRRLARVALPVVLLLLPTWSAGASEPAVYYGGRCVPLSTLSRDFALKTTGKQRDHRQLLRKCVIDFDSYKRQPMLRVGGRELQEAAGLPARVALVDLFSPERGYLLQPYLEAYDRGEDAPALKQAVALGEAVRLAFTLRGGEGLYLFPARTREGELRWYSTTSPIEPGELEERDSLFIRTFLPTLISKRDQPADYDRLLEALVTFQDQMPEVRARRPQMEAEVIYYSLPYPLILFISFVMMVLVSPLLLSKGRRWLLRCGGGLGILLLSLLIGCHAYITGRVPLATGYETSLVIAWVITLLALLLGRRETGVGLAALGSAGFFLLVAHLGMSRPALSPIMPVLHSPLLSLHVSVLMVSYALFSTTAAVGLYALLGRRGAVEQLRLRQVSLLMIYPALFLLALGIVIGAYWANVSWGTYWSWDPKEVWALITLIAYSVLLHPRLFPQLRRPRLYHLSTLLLFGILLMTYFGVNVLLGGLHSYA